MLAPAPSPSVETSLALPRSFWKEFAQQSWDRQPGLFRGLFPGAFPTTEEIFGAVVEASARYLRGEYPPGRIIRFFVEHEDGPDGMPYYSSPFLITKKHLPQPEDRSAEEYEDRVTRTLGGKRFGIVLSRAQSHHWSHWQQMQTFLSSFHQTLGVPLGGSDSAVFFGNYLYTPFGIHKDDLHIFYFVVHGKKRISLWPFEAFSQREEVPKDPDFIHRAGGINVRDKAEEEQLLAQATLLEGQAGDLLYWPASYWHRAEPSQGMAISASLGVSFRPPEFAGRVAPGQWPSRLRHTELPGRKGWQVPAALRKSLQQQSRRESRHAAELQQTADWVRFLTAEAMEGAAPEAVNEAPLTHPEGIRGAPARPIVSVPVKGGQVLVAANGHSTSLTLAPPARRRLEQLLVALNGGEPQRVEMLEESFFFRLKARGFNRRAFRALLDQLLRWRAVQRCEPPQAGC